MDRGNGSVDYGSWRAWTDDAESSGLDGSGLYGDLAVDWATSTAGYNATTPALSAQSEAVLAYFRLATTCVMSVILLVGITGNVLVPIVIAHSKDLRNSTNVFLVNLALADLLVILICLPTGFVELHSTPGAWYLGETMCKSTVLPALAAETAAPGTHGGKQIRRVAARSGPAETIDHRARTRIRNCLVCLARFIAA